MELSARVGGRGGKRDVQLHLYQSAESAGCAIQRPEYGGADEPYARVDDVAEGIGQSNDERHSRLHEVQRPDLPISAGEPPTRLARRKGKGASLGRLFFVRPRKGGHPPTPPRNFPFLGASADFPCPPQK